MKITVGQKLWCVWDIHREVEQREVTVGKVGRVWADLDPRWYGRVRIDGDTLYLDGGRHTSPGQCYLSKADYETELDARAAWQELRNAVERSRVPKGFSAADIRAIINAFADGKLAPAPTGKVE